MSKHKLKWTVPWDKQFWIKPLFRRVVQLGYVNFPLYKLTPAEQDAIKAKIWRELQRHKSWHQRAVLRMIDTEGKSVTPTPPQSIPTVKPPPPPLGKS